MFKTFYLRHNNMADFDRFLGNIVSKGYTLVFVREFFNPWYGVVEVFVTARKAE